MRQYSKSCQYAYNFYLSPLYREKHHKFRAHTWFTLGYNITFMVRHNALAQRKTYTFPFVSSILLVQAASGGFLLYPVLVSPQPA